MCHEGLVKEQDWFNKPKSDVVEVPASFMDNCPPGTRHTLEFIYDEFVWAVTASGYVDSSLGLVEIFATEELAKQWLRDTKYHEGFYVNNYIGFHRDDFSIVKKRVIRKL